VTIAEVVRDRAEVFEDAAWVRVATTLPAAELLAFVEDIERLYRINPLLEISAFEPAGHGRYRLIARNHSNGSDVDVLLTVTPKAGGIEIAYSHGLKTATHFRVESAHDGSHLFVTDIYGGGSEAERRARAREIDLSLNAWGRALHGYLRMWARWSWSRSWRWYMHRVWQPMKPSARRIVWMIWVISIFEVVAMVVLLAIWGIMRQASS
jgi:hypothetical protein